MGCRISSFIIKWVNFLTLVCHRIVKKLVPSWTSPVINMPGMEYNLFLKVQIISGVRSRTRLPRSSSVTFTLFAAVVDVNVHRWLLMQGVAIGVVGFGIWLSSRHGDCDKFLTVPVFVLGVIIFITSFLGFVGAWKDLVCVLCVYLVIMFFLLVGLALFTAFAFVVTNEGAGRAVSGLRYRCFQPGLRNTTSVIIPDTFVDFSTIGKTGNIWRIACLVPNTAWIWRIVTMCNFPMINITYYNLSSRYIPKSASNVTSFHVTYQTVATVSLAGAPTPQLSASSSATMIRDNTGTSVLSSIEAYQSPYRKYDDSDCITYDNDPTSMCFTCSSCKAGVAQYIKKDWRLVAVINIIIFTLIVAIYVIGCCARRNASRAQYIKKLKRREVATERISSRRRSPAGSGGRLSLTSRDEELGREPQVSCWQTRAPGEPEDLVPVQSICPMRAPWSNSPRVKGSTKKLVSPKSKRKSIIKRPRLEGGEMIPSKRPRTGEKEQREHPVLPFGAARRLDTVLNYEDPKSRQEKLEEQYPPPSPANPPSTSDVPRTNKSDNRLLSKMSDNPLPSKGNVRTGGDTVTPTRYVQVKRKSPAESDFETESIKNYLEAPVVDVLDKIPPEDGVREPAKTMSSGDQFGGWWRSKSPEVLHENVLFHTKKRHNNALFEAERSPDPSDTIRQPTTPTYNLGSANQRTVPGETDEHSYKVDKLPHTDVVVALLDDTSGNSESAQDQFTELGGIRVHLRDSGRKIVSWGYEGSEVSEETSIELEGVEGFVIYVEGESGGRTHEILKAPMPAVNAEGPERQMASSVNTVPGVQGVIRKSRRNGSLEGVSVDSAEENPDLPSRLHKQAKDIREVKVTTVDREPERRVNTEHTEQGGLHVTVTDTGTRMVLGTEGVPRARPQAWLGSHVRYNSQKNAPSGSVLKSSVQTEPVRLSKRAKEPKSDNPYGKDVQKEPVKQVGFHTLERGKGERDTWDGNTFEAVVDEEVGNKQTLRGQMRETNRERVSRVHDTSIQRRQQSILESEQHASDARENKRKRVSWADHGSDERVQELKPGVHVRNIPVTDVPLIEDKSAVTEMGKPIQDSVKTPASMRQSESRARHDDKLADIVANESPRAEALHLNNRDLEKEIISSVPEKDVHESAGTGDSERLVVPSGDALILTDPHMKERQYTAPEVEKQPRRKQRKGRTVEIDDPKKLLLKNDEVNETTTSVNYDFAVPTLRRGINPNLGSVKQTKLKSADEEIHEKGVSKYVFDPAKISRTKPTEDETQKLGEKRRSKAVSQPALGLKADEPPATIAREPLKPDEESATSSFQLPPRIRRESRPMPAEKPPRTESQPKLAENPRPNVERKSSRERKRVEASLPNLEVSTRASSFQGSPPESKDRPRQKVGESSTRPRLEEGPLQESTLTVPLKHKEESYPKSLNRRRFSTGSETQPSKVSAAKETQSRREDEVQPMLEERPRTASRKEHQPRPSLGQDLRSDLKSERRPRPQEEPTIMPVDSELHNFDGSGTGESSARRKSRRRIDRPQQPD
ncbi:hypothetical protein R1sor_023547 [Riccia sorocarpa]|uniref:Uncharacterized protein n=1 Tax=Riccia sorocarpa TaxID=122646 RepID=A0ABD3GRZ5_9MARC